MNLPHNSLSSSAASTPMTANEQAQPNAPRRPRPLALSPSRASDYNQCPLLYRLRAIDRLPEPKTIAQVKGTLVHAALEKTHELPRDERTYPRAVKFLKPEWELMREKDTELKELVPEDETIDFLIDARELVKGYFQMEIALEDRKSTRLNSSHVAISYAVFCLKKKTK